AYFPSGSSGDEAQARKDEFLRQILPTLSAWQQEGKSLILCGDVNIVHKAIDIKNWKSNQKNSGCLPHERAWLDTLFDQVGYVDAFRVKNQQAHEYSWWSNRGQAYANNVGWRIDYQIASADWHNKIQQVAIFREVKFSDHAPVIVDYCLQG
ncbi:MAG: exodeoxyribonuclease III, partial [Flavobacteriales bacterium]